MLAFNIVLLCSVVCARNVCTKFTPNMVKTFQCVNMNRTMIKIVVLTKTPSRNLDIEDFVNDMIPNLQDLELSYFLKRYTTNFEYSVIDYSELYSWTGKQFNLRKGQMNKTTVIYDGIDVAHSNQIFRETTSSAVVVVVENIDILLDDYLIGSPRPPFHLNRSVFNIVILEKTENWSKKVSTVLGRMWRNYGITISVLIFTCEDEVSKLFVPYNILSV